MSQTPYELIHRKDRERKLSLLGSIQKKDLKLRSISYNFKSNRNNHIQHSQKSEKLPQKQINKITITNSIKKSFYYRKLLNRSINCHPTSDDFQKVKQKFDRINKLETTNENKALYFREIWQNQQNKKIMCNVGNQQQNLLSIVPKNHQKLRQTLQDDSEDRKLEQRKSKFEDISDIAKQRKQQLNFDLEIMGNKKSIRIKENSIKVKQRDQNRTLSFTEKLIEQTEKIKEHTENHCCKQKSDELILEIQVKQIEPKCTFFKRFQEENSPNEAIQENHYLRIKKINQEGLYPNIGKTPSLKSKQYNKLRLKQLESETQPIKESYEKRQIQSSYRSSLTTTTIQGRRYSKPETSEERRVTIIKKNKIKLPNFINDIRGWNIGLQNQEQIQAFGS